jgi:hypothetical protein
MSFTTELRKALHEAGWKPGKRLTFYLRMKNGKRKKVRGQFVRLGHRYRRGFFITLCHIHWMGHYWGNLELSFSTRQIEWDEHFAVAFAGAMDMARQKMPRLEANTPG